MKINKIKLNKKEAVLNVWFEHNKQKAKFSYALLGNDAGVLDCNYWEKDKTDDIYAEIHYWIGKHILIEIKVLLDGKELKK